MELRRHKDKGSKSEAHIPHVNDSPQWCPGGEKEFIKRENGSLLNERSQKSDNIIHELGQRLAAKTCLCLSVVQRDVREPTTWFFFMFLGAQYLQRLGMHPCVRPVILVSVICC